MDDLPRIIISILGGLVAGLIYQVILLDLRINKLEKDKEAK